MKKYLPYILALLIFILGVGTTVLASDTSAAIWSGIVQVTNNSTAATGVSVNFSANTASLISGGYMNSSGNNTAIQFGGSDVAYMPGYGGNPWIVYQSSIGANTILDGTLYTGGTTDMAAKLRYFPSASGASVADAPSIEPGDNWTVGITATGASGSGYIIQKPSAFYLQKIGSIAISANFSTTANETPLATTTAVGWVTPDNSWDDNTGTFAEFTIPTLSWSNNLTLEIDASTVSRIRFWVTREINTVTTVEVDLSSSGATWFNIYSAEPTYGAWVDIPIDWKNATYLRIRALSTDGGLARWFRVHELQYSPTVSNQKLTNLTGTERAIQTTSNGTHMWLTVDGSDSVVVVSATMYNNANNWQFGGDITPYIYSANITKGGNLKASWTPMWEYAATFTDDSGNGNTMTPSFRTTSSDADVSAELVGFGPIEEADAPPYTVTNPPDLITANISVSGGFTSNTTGSSVPGIDVITAVAAASGTPVPFILYLIAGVALLGLSMGTSFLMRDGGSTSLVIKILIILGALGILIAIDVFDDWVLYLFAMLAIGIAFIASNRTFDGTGNFNNNLLGFLIMAWLGLSVVNNILEGVILTTAERSMMNNFLIFQPWNIAGLFTLPVPSISFLTVGLPALMEWDYTAFGGNAQIFTYLMYSITGVVAFLFFTVAMASAANMFFRSR